MIMKNRKRSKKKYDSAINQVIELENERLKSENKPEIKRNGAAQFITKANSFGFHITWSRRK